MLRRKPPCTKWNADSDWDYYESEQPDERDIEPDDEEESDDIIDEPYNYYPTYIKE